MHLLKARVLALCPETYNTGCPIMEATCNFSPCFKPKYNSTKTLLPMGFTYLEYKLYA